MFTKLANSLFGSRNQRNLKNYRKQVELINSLEPGMRDLSMESLSAKTEEFKKRHVAGESLDKLLPEAFAVVREASRRLLGMRHFDVQLIGGMALHNGKIAEMSTGEGKTLMATLAVYLNALTGKPVHVVTVNDYLARRDAGWMGPIYVALGLTVGVVIPRRNSDVKRESYQADVIYATNNELGFDYLRNKMAFSAEECLQTELHFAIVDEVDSILVDEARTPLIISGAADDSSELYMKMNLVAPLLVRQEVKDGPGDYQLDEKTKQTFLTEEGHETAEKLLAKEGLIEEGQSLYDSQNLVLLHHLNAAIRAHAIYKKDVDYLIQDNKVVIVDEHTGRSLAGRRWSEGLHQAVEAKEGVEIQQESQTLASITFQNFFKLYSKISGMTGTADTEAFEFQEIYGLEVVVLPTNKPCVRKDYPDVIYLSQEEKFTAIIEDIKDNTHKNRPILVGTVSIETSEFLSGLLKKAKVPHKVLNAKYHEQEAEIISEAGRPGAVTIATNMAGRGTDIELGGSLKTQLDALGEATPEKIAELKAQWQKKHDQVVEAGGLHIIGTERHESRRIDNQLRGRAGRQGDPGSSRFYLSLEDNLMRIFGSDKMINMMRRLGVQKGEAITHSIVSRAIENSQRKVEGHNFDIRKQLLDYDNVANDQRQVIYAQRDNLMVQEDLSTNMTSLIAQVSASVVNDYIPPESIDDLWDIAGLEQYLQHEFRIDLPLKHWLESDANLNEEGLREKILTAFNDVYKSKEDQIGTDLMRRFEKSVMLNSLDTHWKEHLAQMDHLRQSVGLRGYAQKDPKQEYKKEAFNLFKSMLESIKREVVSVITKVEVRAQEDVDAIDQQRRQSSGLPMDFHHDDIQGLEQESMMKASEGVLAGDTVKVGRNDACPCGSSKKYKQCHGKLA